MNDEYKNKYDYLKLLKDGIKQIPKDAYSKERFEIPVLRSTITGSKTEISNFIEAAKQIYRDPKEIQKYLEKELASPGSIDRQRIIFKGNIGAGIINTKFKRYVEEFVLCHECKKPDTKIIKEGRMTYMKCTACGAKRPIEKIV